MTGSPPSPDELPHLEFAIVPVAFYVVCPLAQALYAHARRNATLSAFTLKQRLILLRHRARRITFIGEAGMRIIEPQGQPGLTVLKTDGNSAILSCLSALLPTVEFIEFESLYESKRRQRHGLYLRKAGKFTRRAVASIGIESAGWTWEDTGQAQDWERTAGYSNNSISERQTRETLLAHMRALGVDPVRTVSGEGVARVARFRGSGSGRA